MGPHRPGLAVDSIELATSGRDSGERAEDSMLDADSHSLLQALNVIIDTGSANFALAAKPFAALGGQA